jgi:hypothetical protein
MVVPLFVGRQKSIRALEEAMNRQKFILLAAQKDAKTNEPAEADIYRVGTLGTVVQLLRLPDGTVKVLVEGKKRARIQRYVQNPDFFLVEVEEIEEVAQGSTEIEALCRSVNSTFENYVKLNKKIPPEMIMSVASITRSFAARGHDRRPPGHQARGQAGPARGNRPRAASREGPRLHAVGDRDPRGREAHPDSRQEANGEDAEGVLPQRADARDPEGAR